jgi:thioredoxin-related protein
MGGSIGRNGSGLTINLTMKTQMIGVLAVCLFLWQAGAEESHWLTDLPQAEAVAKKEHKLVMMAFTGSDWCPDCMRLRKEVFAQPEFAEYAAKNLVPVEVDFPHKKEQSAGQKKANLALREEYKVHAYPTVIVLNGEGVKLGELEYDTGGPKAFIGQLEKLEKK